MTTRVLSVARLESAVHEFDLNVFSAREKFDSLVDWLQSDEARALSLHEIEAHLLPVGREAMNLLLQAHLAGRGTGDVGASIEVTSDSATLPFHAKSKLAPRKLTTRFGKLEIQRTAYAAPGHESVHPLDEALQLPKRAVSYTVQRHVAEGVARGPFDEALETLKSFTGVHVCKRTAEQVVADVAEDFDAFYVQRQAPNPEETGPILVASVDCKGVPLLKREKAKKVVRLGRGEKRNQKKMATVATVYDQEPRVRTPEEVVESLFDEKEDDPKTPRPRRAKPGHKRVWASLRKTKDEVIDDMRDEVEARDPEQSKTRVVVTDGERALQLRVGSRFKGAIFILDIIHVLERLWTVAHAIHGEGTDKAMAWARSHALMVLCGKVGQAVKGMRQSCTKRKLTGKRKSVIMAAAAYLYRNKQRMRYHEYLAAGLPIASGAVEGACKNLVKDRMERSGMRWTVDGAEAVLKLRAIERSHDMDEYWPFHIQQEQDRLYGKRTWEVVDEE